MSNALRKLERSVLHYFRGTRSFPKGGKSKKTGKMLSPRTVAQVYIHTRRPMK